MNTIEMLFAHDVAKNQNDMEDEKHFQNLPGFGEINKKDLVNFCITVQNAIDTVTGHLTIDINIDDLNDLSYGMTRCEDYTSEYNIIFDAIMLILSAEELAEIIKELGKEVPEALESLQVFSHSMAEKFSHRLIPFSVLTFKTESPWITKSKKYIDNLLTEIPHWIIDPNRPNQHLFREVWEKIKKHDPMLKELIDKKVEFFQELPGIVKDSWAIRWIMAADKVAAVTHMPKSIIEAGSMRVVSHALNQDNPQEVIFQAAVQGMGLTHTSRLSVLKCFESGLKAGELKGFTPTGSLLLEWLEHQDDHILIKAIQSLWLERLEAIAKVLGPASSEYNDAPDRLFVMTTIGNIGRKEDN